jgi:hypothetical protein
MIARASPAFGSRAAASTRDHQTCSSLAPSRRFGRPFLSQRNPDPTNHGRRDIRLHEIIGPITRQHGDWQTITVVEPPSVARGSEFPSVDPIFRTSARAPVFEAVARVARQSVKTTVGHLTS